MQFIGSVGTLIGSAMETSGHYLQAQMLDILQAGLASSLGGLLFTIAGISAIFIFAVGGQYKYGLWFLIGPPLFYFIISSRVPSQGADWTMGSRTHQQEDVTNATAGITIEDNSIAKTEIPPMQVSWIFTRWNQIVSTTVNQFVDLLQLTSFNSDLTFLNKAEKYKSLFNLRTLDPQLRLFTNIALFDKCAEYYTLKRYIYDPTIEGTPQQRQLKERLEKIGNSTRFSLNDHPEIRTWLTDAKYEDGLKSVVGDRQVLSCDDLWKVAINLYKKDADTLIHKIAVTNLPKDMTAYEYKKKLAKKFQQKTDSIDGSVDKNNSINDEQSMLLMTNEIAARMLVSELSEIDPGITQLGMDKSTRTNELIGRDILSDTSHSIRQMSKREEFQGKGDFLTMALTLPYIQGMALYFLAATFPFFAMALILPGRHGVFLLWMALWVWVKSWDFGFGVVMIVDEILYFLMPHGPAFTDEITKDPGQAYKALLEVDPTYSVHTYYNLLAACMAAIPIVSYALVKKGGDEVSSALKEGYHKFSGRVGGAMAAYQANLITQGKFAEAAKHTYAKVDQNTLNFIQDPYIKERLIASMGANAFGGLLKSLSTGSVPASQLKAVLGQVSGLAKSYQQRLAITKFEANLNEIVYRESLKVENQQRAHDGVLVKWYSHDFAIDPPVESRLKLIQEKYHLDFGGAVDSTGNSFLGLIKTATKKGKFTTGAEEEVP